MKSNRNIKVFPGRVKENPSTFSTPLLIIHHGILNQIDRAVTWAGPLTCSSVFSFGSFYSRRFPEPVLLFLFVFVFFCLFFFFFCSFPFLFCFFFYSFLFSFSSLIFFYKISYLKNCSEPQKIVRAFKNCSIFIKMGVYSKIVHKFKKCSHF